MNRTNHKSPQRPDPDALLAQIQAESGSGRGRLRIYLGAAPGVGKTFAMLQEAHRRKERGTDVVVGLVETHGRPHTAEQIGDLDIIPPLEVLYKGVILRELDAAAVIARHPQVVLVDELAHSNAPGSLHAKRYEDVQELLDAGINVISTLNIQHIESLNDSVKQLTGVAVRETIPDWVLDEAEQVELIDMAPEALIQRMKHGNVYPPDQARRALAGFFTTGNLTVLRDLALRATAREVEERLSHYMHGQTDGAGPVVSMTDRILVAVDHRPFSRALIRRGWRMAAALKGTLTVVHVEPDSGSRQAQTTDDERQLRTILQLADELGATVVRLRGDIAAELLAYAHAQGITHLVIGHSTHSRWHEFLHGSVTHAILRHMQGIDVHVIGENAHEAPTQS